MADEAPTDSHLGTALDHLLAGRESLTRRLLGIPDDDASPAKEGDGWAGNGTH